MKSFEIVITGCDGACPECHSKELWDFDLGEPLVQWIKKFEEKFEMFDDMIDIVFIYGGEPLLQNRYELLNLIKYIKQKGKPVLLFTRSELDEVDDEIKAEVDYIKTGEYDPDKKGKVEYYGVTLETTNQRVWKKEKSTWI